MPRVFWLALSLLVALLFALGPAFAPRPSYAAGVVVDPLLERQMLAAAPGTPLGAIVTYASQPTRDDLAGLLGAGASIAPLQRLPMVGVVASPAQLATIRQLPGVSSIYANQPLEYFLSTSVQTISATEVWEQYGYDGAGVGVAVLDTGIDATHPDLTYGQRTVANVKILGLQYAAGEDLDAYNLPVAYQEELANTDTTSGHGTHVAGIVGSSGEASEPYRSALPFLPGPVFRGVAPGARLIGLGAGEGIEIFTALAGFDWILTHKDDPALNIRVVNCSWGNIVPGFDPNNPINKATRTLHDAGVTVVFASGNSGAATDTLNTYSVAPWVISVAAGEKDRKELAFFSSRGIPGDDLFHPTITAPGYAIISDRASTGAATSANTAPTDPIFMMLHPQYMVHYTAASGTSMAAPHVAGAIALMLQANPTLTPDVIKRVLVNTATPMAYQEYAAGAGYLNVKAAVDTARGIKRVRAYRDPRTGKESLVYDLTARWDGTVEASAVTPVSCLSMDFLPAPGSSASRSHTLTVQPGTLSLEVALDWSTYASDLNLFLFDPDGALVASSTTCNAIYQSPSERVYVDAPAAGAWTVTVAGFLNAPQDYRATSNAVVLVRP